VRDDFTEPKLDLEWNHVRNPDPSRYNLSERPGWLRLKGAAATLCDHGPQTALVRRQRDSFLRFATLMDFNPARDGEEAGLS
jgi:alpha-N-arabinofuranosidase